MSGSLYLDTESRDFSFSLVVTTETYNSKEQCVFICWFFFFSAYESAMEE